MTETEIDDRSERPDLSAAVIALAVFSLMWAGLGLIGGVLALVLPLLVGSLNAKGPGMELYDDPFFVAWNTGANGLGLILAGVLLAASIGLFIRRPWAATLGRIYAASAIAMTVAGAGFMAFYMYPAMMKSLEDAPPAQRAGAIGGLIGGGIGLCVGLIIPVAMLLCLRTRHFQEQLGLIAPTDEAAEVFD